MYDKVRDELLVQVKLLAARMAPRYVLARLAADHLPVLHHLHRLGLLLPQTDRRGEQVVCRGNQEK